MTTQNGLHFLLIACPAQGHINPTLQLAKCLARAGHDVTFATTANGVRLINVPTNLDRLSFATFSTGFDDGVKPSDDPRHVAEEFKRVGSKSVYNLIVSLSNQGRPISLLIYTLMLPWAADVAHELHVPSAFLCIQSAAAFAIYHRYFDGCKEGDGKSPPSCVELPGLPLFQSRDLPTFLLPSSPHYFAAPTFEDHIRVLERDPNPTVLVNTFDALEEHAIMAVDHHDGVKMLTIGPLIPSAFSDMSDPSDTSYGCDLFQSSTDYLSWLGSKADKSVVYVSFGSMAALRRKLFEEILHGLVQTGRPYLWVIRPMTHNKIEGEEDEVVIDDIVKNGVGLIGGLEDQGLIVPWCSQVEVLSHRAIGCFVTHCGWNSILEGLVMGVPMVGVPLISDQPTNAKMVEEVWQVGLRVKGNEEAGAVDREDIRVCVEVVMGEEERGEEIRRNTKKWMELALEAAMEGGSSHSNLARYLEEFQSSQMKGDVISRKLSLSNIVSHEKEVVEKEELFGKIIGKK